MKKKYKLLFKYDIDEVQAGSVKELELSEKDLNRLLRRGCIFADKDAKLTKETAKKEKPASSKKEEVKEDKKQEEEKPGKELDNVVDNKKSNKRSKVQTNSTDKE